MAFTVEDGTIVAGANSYAATVDADDYFEERGITAWAGTDTQKEQWLVQATDYIEMRFAARFIGERTDVVTPQSLSWPRKNTGVYDSDEIPEPLKRAIYEYANKARVAPLVSDPSVDASGLSVQRSRRKVGPIETETQYLGGARRLFKSYPVPDALIRSLLVSVPGVIR